MKEIVYNLHLDNKNEFLTIISQNKINFNNNNSYLMMENYSNYVKKEYLIFYESNFEVNL